MEGNEEYGVFGIVSCIAGFWHASTLIIIFSRQSGGWIFAIISAGIIWAVTKYAKWLFKPSNRLRLIIILLLSEAFPTILFLFLFLGRR